MRDLTQTDISMLENMNQSLKMSHFANMTHGEALAFSQMWWWLQGFLKELKDEFHKAETRKKVQAAIAQAREIKNDGDGENSGAEVSEAKHGEGKPASQGAAPKDRSKGRGRKGTRAAQGGLGTQEAGIKESQGQG